MEDDCCKLSLGDLLAMNSLSRCVLESAATTRTGCDDCALMEIPKDSITVGKPSRFRFI
jgi:hypothetical protein